MATAARPANNKVDMLTNVPIRMSIKYIDVYPDSGKGYGASMRLKGTIDGADAIVYPKGKVWAAVKAMKAAGVIDSGGEYEDDPTEKYSIPVLHADVEMVMRQAAGEKYANFSINTCGEARTVPATPKPVSTTKQPTNIGGPLPWEQEETGAPPARADVPASFALYDRCFEHAFKVASAAKITDQQAIASMAATLYIQANK
jgi:hypothetical protein